MKKNEDFITFNGNKVFLNSGFSKIDVTMVFKIGLAIGNKSFKDVEYFETTIN